MFKKIMYFLCLVLSLAGCKCKERKDGAWFALNDKLKVLTTTEMIGDLVRQVGGEHVDTLVLIQGELDPHTYELVKGDDEKFGRAQILFYNGLGLEHGLSLRENIEKHACAVPVTRSILARDPQQVLEVDGEKDPHVWMDVALWLQTVDPIVETLVAKDPDHQEVYRQNGEHVKQKLCEIDTYIFSSLQAIPEEKRYLITSHDAFHYFARHYLAILGEENWQRRCTAPEGLAPEAQLSLNDIIAIVTHVRSFGVKVLFPESNISKDSLRKILDVSTKQGVALRLCSDPLYGDSMGDAPSYVDMLLHNARVIARELSDE